MSERTSKLNAHQKNMPETTSSNLESYPPLFRQLNSHVSNMVDPVESTEDTQVLDPVPLIDLQCLNLEKLKEACKNWGIFRLVNHGIPSTLLSQLQDHAKKLFSLSFESKQALFTSPLSYFWGTAALTSSGAALRGTLSINRLEGLNAPLGQLPELRSEDPLLGSFSLLLEEYGRHLGRIATTLFEGIAKNLNLDLEQCRSKYLSEATGFIRVYRYPPSSKANDACGLDLHTDSSVLSILHQDQVGGLQVFKDTECFLVKPIPETLIVNVGDMMQAISDDEYVSVKHRVKVNTPQERFSICYFVFPAEGCAIHSSKYRPFTYSDFQAQVQADIETVGFKVGLERFKLSSRDG